MERKNFLRSLTAKPEINRRLLTSVCGILLIVSIILTNNTQWLDDQTQSDSGNQLGLTLKAILLTLNVIFLLIFLASTLALIKEEDSVSF